MGLPPPPPHGDLLTKVEAHEHIRSKTTVPSDFRLLEGWTIKIVHFRVVPRLTGQARCQSR